MNKKIVGEKLCVPSGHRRHGGETGKVVIETRFGIVLEFENGDRYMYPKICVQKTL